eukprot:GHVS01035262.1.p1 GENE.GHVS01035262.1~~GHVS01035262.1.p1  ORF type:complete len:570 (+),score=71.02 GHVS01035262.1:207-1916(+)
MRQPTGFFPSLALSSPRPPVGRPTRTPARRARPKTRRIRGLGLLDSQPGFPSGFSAALADSPPRPISPVGSFGFPRSRDSAASEASRSSDHRSPPAPTPRRPLRRQPSASALSAEGKSGGEEPGESKGEVEMWGTVGRLTSSSPSTRFPSSPPARLPSSPNTTPTAFPGKLPQLSSYIGSTFAPNAAGIRGFSGTAAAASGVTKHGTRLVPARPIPFDKQRLQTGRGKASRAPLYPVTTQSRPTITSATTMTRMRLSGSSCSNSQTVPNRSAFRHTTSPGGRIRDVSRSRLLHGYSTKTSSATASLSGGTSGVRRFGGHNLRHSGAGVASRRGPPSASPMPVWLLQHHLSISVKCLVSAAPHDCLYEIPPFANHQLDEPVDSPTDSLMRETTEPLPEVVVQLEGHDVGADQSRQEEVSGGSHCLDGPCTPMSCTSTCSSPVPGNGGATEGSSSISPFATAVSSIVHNHAQLTAFSTDEQHEHGSMDDAHMTLFNGHHSSKYMSTSAHSCCLVKQVIRVPAMTNSMMEEELQTEEDMSVASVADTSSLHDEPGMRHGSSRQGSELQSRDP